LGFIWLYIVTSATVMYCNCRLQSVLISMK